MKPKLFYESTLTLAEFAGTSNSVRNKHSGRTEVERN